MERKRIVVKIGTSSLTYPDGRLQLSQIERIVREIADLVNAGNEIILVTSGAIGAGMSRLGLTTRPEGIQKKQALAAVGQVLLMQMYSKIFAEYCHVCAQVLLTTEDLQQRNRYLNSRNTLETLLKDNVIPVVNENDSVAVEEIKFGDNDTLSALVASLVSADLLVILSDIDGVYNKDPRKFTDAELIREIKEITPEILNLAGEGGNLGTGGMITKLHAAKMVRCSGIPMIIANSSQRDVIKKAIAKEAVGTWFVPQEVVLPSRKRWLAFQTHPQGTLLIDSGAVAALEEGKSLLPIGVKECFGRFSSGDLVQIIDCNRNEIAKGLTNYSSQEIFKIKGKGSEEIENMSVDHPYIEVVHRDNMVLTKHIGR